MYDFREEEMASKQRSGISVFCDKEIPLSTIIKEFEKVGTPNEVHVEKHRYEPDSRKVTMVFNTEREITQAYDLRASLVRQNKFKRTSRRATPYTTSSRDNRERSRDNLVEVTYQKHTNVKSEIHVVSPQPTKHAVCKNRLFCLLPWDQTDREKDELFFRHFAQYGTMTYYETVRDKKGRLSYGYVQYFKEEEAEKARTQSEALYKATYAEPRKLPKQATGIVDMKFHEKCKNMVEKEIYHLHEITCKKQMSWSTKEEEKESDKDQGPAEVPTLLEIKKTLAYLKSIEKQNNINEETNVNAPETSESKVPDDIITLEEEDLLLNESQNDSDMSVD